ncbi:DUF3083 family protein [Colwellia sp. MSW7]|uniref:DUF3083 family protein n=1 Tax=Colwellia maritima TaxID=2912588 RepID=A0ABS9X1N5_9GAMM|nr:DUF3083 family protein [Colwellia maritima]MCI2284163.1 DUF3083 family protein [Colwellia maritima]
MSITRMRNAQHKVHIPNSVRENQYLMVKFPLTDQLISKFSKLVDESASDPYTQLYQELSKKYFDLCNIAQLDNTQFIANDKFARVRYSPEKMTSETKQQLLFLYNPNYHTSQNSYFDGAKRTKKITLLFLANGNDVRAQSAKFHAQVKQVVSEYAKLLELDTTTVRICDHQHLTYDLFAGDKGVEGKQVHKFRPMTNRYATDGLEIPDSKDALTYAVVDLPINRRIRSLVTIEENSAERYSELYNLIADAFISSAKHFHLNNGAVIANGLVPIVRSALDENVIASGELLMLGYNPSNTTGGYTCKWNADKLVDTVQLIFVASEKNKTPHGYGKFVNQIQQALRSIAQSLDFINDKEEMLVRLHQHVGYYLTDS